MCRALRKQLRPAGFVFTTICRRGHSARRDDDNLIVGQHESAKTRVPFKFTHAHIQSKKGTIDSDT